MSRRFTIYVKNANVRIEFETWATRELAEAQIPAMEREEPRFKGQLEVREEPE